MNEIVKRAAKSAAGWPSWTGLRSYSSSFGQVTDPQNIRDFAIIAHIDHGKTTLMDRLLSQCGTTLTHERAMDSNSMERERGITILSKYTSFMYKQHLVNAVDTPGHADFGGEVERILGMVDGAVLLVDAAEGPLAQTKFVLAKALSRGLAPIVVLNKVDRPAATQARCDAVASQLFDLFASLGADDRQLDFPILYASSKQGWASLTLPPLGNPPEGASMAPLLDVILAHVPPPQVSLQEPFAMCVAMIERDPFVGRVATGRIQSGQVAVGDKVKVLQYESGQVIEQLKITRIEKKAGLGKVQLQSAVAGDVVSIAGPGDAAGIADTIAAPAVAQALDPGPIDPPTLSMVFSANDSPLAGKAGKAVTGRTIGQRLAQEAEASVSLRVKAMPGGTEKYEVQARGEMQLAVVIEGMRREGMELAVSPPQVLLREENGRRLEPLEEVVLEVDGPQVGTIIEALTGRKGELLEVTPVAHGFGAAAADSSSSSAAQQQSSSSSEGSGSVGSIERQRLVFEVPARGMIGFKTFFAGFTRGEGLMQRAFARYGPYRGPISGSRKGVLVSMSDGRATTYAMYDLVQRGTFFISPGEDVYAGMVVGENNRDADMDVNPAKEKHLTNVRSVQADEKMVLPPPRAMTLEEAIGYVAEDELIEVTPAAIRLRKQVLDAGQRKVAAKRAAAAAAAAS
ncbi:hypothetical protein OEZ86_012003 [Tetradesmus obliquus]|nr:hypothetical protein OEZ86_012003 [Tetradesmus obliquus]